MVGKGTERKDRWMDIEGERKSQRRRKRDSRRDRAQDGDIGKNEGKGEVVSP